MTSTSKPPPGLIFPSVKSYPVGSGNPRDAAIQQMKINNSKQASLNLIGGRKYYKKKICSRKILNKKKVLKKIKTYNKRSMKSKKRRKGGSVIVPQMHMSYIPQNGNGTNPNDQIKQLSQLGMQNAEWSKNDQLALQK